VVLEASEELVEMEVLVVLEIQPLPEEQVEQREHLVQVLSVE
jgi:hypothetical protein